DLIFQHNNGGGVVLLKSITGYVQQWPDELLAHNLLILFPLSGNPYLKLDGDRSAGFSDFLYWAI
ncbi:MAG: hypothetical protein RLZZ143_3427, partial [Cyanobacteriota bacterium]